MTAAYSNTHTRHTDIHIHSVFLERELSWESLLDRKKASVLTPGQKRGVGTHSSTEKGVRTHFLTKKGVSTHSWTDKMCRYSLIDRKKALVLTPWQKKVPTLTPWQKKVSVLARWQKKVPVLILSQRVQLKMSLVSVLKSKTRRFVDIVVSYFDICDQTTN